MRIAFISLMSGIPWGGSEALWHATALHALNQKDDVLISIYDWGKLHSKVSKLKQKGATLHLRKRYNPNENILKKIKRYINSKIFSIEKVYKPVVDFKPDTVFISQGDSFDLAVHHYELYKRLKEKNISYSIVCHGHFQYSSLPEDNIYPGAVTIFRDAHKIFFISARQQQLIERQLACKLTNASFTWNPLNLKIDACPVKWFQQSIVQFAVVASLNGSKGHDTLLEVLSNEDWEKRDWRLNVYGDGPGKKYLVDLVSFFKLNDKVDFHGYVDDIIKVWQQNHLLLIPSAGEGLPISLVEAMLCGRPAVVTDVGGNTEVITEGETGFIAAAPTVSSFSAALERAWQNKGQLQKLGLNAYSSIQEKLDFTPQIKVYNYLTK